MCVCVCVCVCVCICVPKHMYPSVQIYECASIIIGALLS